MTYVKAFEDAELDRRRSAVRHRMEDGGFDLLVRQDPANMNWLTGFDGWSFHTPQAVLVHRDDEAPIWFGRAQDARSASITTNLPAANIVAFSGSLVHHPTGHPFDELCERADPATRLGACPDRRRLRRPLLHRQSALPSGKGAVANRKARRRHRRRRRPRARSGEAWRHLCRSRGGLAEGSQSARLPQGKPGRLLHRPGLPSRLGRTDREPASGRYHRAGSRYVLSLPVGNVARRLRRRDLGIVRRHGKRRRAAVRGRSRSVRRGSSLGTVPGSLVSQGTGLGRGFDERRYAHGHFTIRDCGVAQVSTSAPFSPRSTVLEMK